MLFNYFLKIKYDDEFEIIETWNRVTYFETQFSDSFALKT